MHSTPSISYKIGKRLGRAAATVKGALQGNSVRVVWWDGVKNFGDMITPELFSHYGYTAINGDGSDAQFTCVGSILHILPRAFKGTVLGSGCINNEMLSLDNANFCFVRGELTKHTLHLPSSTPTGDLGLLAARVLGDPPAHRIKRKRFGIIPHYADKNNPWFRYATELLGEDCLVIDVADSARNVINKISSCEAIISSSLHGVVIADSLHIPNAWVVVSDNVIGDGFKFHDYNSSIDHEQTPLKFRKFNGLQDVERCLSKKKDLVINAKVAELEKLFIEALGTNN